MSIKILHGADLHLDSPFDALPEEKAVLRRQEQRELLGRIAALCRQEAVDLVLLSGDLLDSGVSYYETQQALQQMLAEIPAQVCIAPGNHDYYCSTSPYARLEFSPNVHIFTSPLVEYIDLPEKHCRVWGAGFPAPLCPSLLQGFRVSEPDLCNIMVLHGELKGERYSPITEADIAASGLDYLALGHVHSFSGFHRAGETVYAYPGCPEGRGFDETGEKGVILGTVEKGRCDLAFHPLGGRAYRQETVDVTGKSDVAEAIRQVIPPDSKGDICRILLTGTAAAAPDLAELTQQLQDCCFHLVLRDRTRPAEDLWQGTGENTLKGQFLARMAELYQAAEDGKKDAITAAVKYGLGALENREDWQP